MSRSNTCSRLWGLLFALSLIQLPTAAAAEPPAQEKIDPQHAEKMARGLDLFKSQVRGVLANRCVKCHGGEETEADFDLTTRAGILAGGSEGKAIVLGNAKESRLYQLIMHQQEPEMPQDESKLPAEQIAAIAKWIELGAPYDKPLRGEEDDTPWPQRKIDPSARQYWAFQPLKVVDPPAVKNESWCRTPVDRFALAAMQAKGLTPNDPAGRRVLIRRAYFDLIGLPPTAEEVQQFLQDKDPKVYEKLIDRLLVSPHYGERWGRHWLDVARFAESHGFEQDYDRPHAYHYRDFVIKALNQDMPYDQFVRWQLAGDELAPDEPLAMMATGFLGAGVFPTQLTEKEFESARYDELDDMAGTMGTAMLGMTIGCARCHDHKFDPLPQADYYRILASFTTTIRSEIEIDIASPQQRQLAKQQHEAKLAKLAADLAQFEKQRLPELFAKFVKESGDGLAAETGPWQVLNVSSHTTAHGTQLAAQPDGSLLATGNTPAKDTYTLQAETTARNLTALRLEALAHASFPHKGPGRAGNGNFCLSDISITAAPKDKPDQAQPVKLTATRVTHEQDSAGLAAKASFDDDKATTGWAVDRGGIGKDQAAVFVFEKPVGFEQGTTWTVTLRFDHPNTKHALGRPRLAVTSHDPQNVAIDGAARQIPAGVAETIRQLAQGKDQPAAARDAALKWYAATLPAWQKLKAALDSQRAAGVMPSGAKKVKVMVTSEGFPPMKHHADGRGFPHFYKQTHFLKRGDANQKQGVAEQGFLQVLTRAPEGTKHWQVDPPEGWRTSYRRRALAGWVTDTQYGAGHLLARVMANRLWQHHLGRGIVSTPNDFGAQAELPTHPQLLDWLAAELIAGQWRLKRLHKLLMTSSVYMQSSAYDEADAKIDPENRFVWRYSPQRLEAELIRDAMLAVSGQLDRKMFGPGTLDEGMNRRSIYFMIKRSKLVPMMQLFDAPEPLVSQGRRPATTIAPQALLFLNNNHVRSYALSFAGKLAPAADKPWEEAVKLGYVMAVARDPDEAELKDMVAFLETQMKSYQQQNKPNARQLALADLCQILMSLNEFVFIE